MAEMLFKKDGATARLSNVSIAVVREMFLPQNLNPSVNHLKVAVYEEVAAV